MHHPPNQPADRCIRADILYPIAEVNSLGFPDSTIRLMRRNGLDVRYIHGRGFVLGQALIDYVLQNGKRNKDEKPESED